MEPLSLTNDEVQRVLNAFPLLYAAVTSVEFRDGIDTDEDIEMHAQILSTLHAHLGDEFTTKMQDFLDAVHDEAYGDDDE